MDNRMMNPKRITPAAKTPQAAKPKGRKLSAKAAAKAEAKAKWDVLAAERRQIKREIKANPAFRTPEIDARLEKITKEGNALLKILGLI